MKKLLNCMVMGLAVASLMFTSCKAAIDDNSGMLIAAAAASGAPNNSGASNNKDDKTEVAILTGVDFTNTSTLMLGKTAELGIILMEQQKNLMKMKLKKLLMMIALNLKSEIMMTV